MKRQICNIIHSLMSHINISFNCDPGVTFCTLLLVVFGSLQWKAVKEQNKQNLFKMRFEHYTKVKKYLTDIFVDLNALKNVLSMERREGWQIHLNNAMQQAKTTIKSATPENRELHYLFGIKMAQYWLSFFSNVEKFIEGITKETTEDYITSELSDLGWQQMNVIEQFNKSLNLDT